MHFTGWSHRHDEWVDSASGRVLKQWRRGRPLLPNNRLDVKDVKGKWLEARVVEVSPSGSHFKVHFVGWVSKWDETIPASPAETEQLLDTKYAEVGSYSKAQGFAKYHRGEAQGKTGKDLKEGHGMNGEDSQA